MKLFFLLFTSLTFLFADVPQEVLNTKSSVVKIIIQNSKQDLISTDTGFVISKDGKVATNFHVLFEAIKNDSYRVSFKTANGKYFLPKSLHSINGDDDIVIINTTIKDVEPILLDTSTPKIGMDVYTIGTPSGMEFSVSNGIVSNILSEGTKLQTTAPVSVGSSGSPLLNKKGQAIGIITSILKESQNINFAHSSKLIKKELESKPLNELSEKEGMKKFQKTDTMMQLFNAGIPKVDENLYKQCDRYININTYVASKKDKFIMAWILTPIPIEMKDKMNGADAINSLDIYDYKKKRMATLKINLLSYNDDKIELIQSATPEKVFEDIEPDTYDECIYNSLEKIFY